MQNSKSEVDNLARFDASRTIEHCTVVYFDGIPGFAWYDRLGNRHTEGLQWPKVNVVHDANVELLYNSETGEKSAGWRKAETEDEL